MYCSVCERHHHVSAFTARQKRKSSKTRVCKNPVTNVTKYLTTSELADLAEFGSSRIFVAERYEAGYNSDYD
jgi:hypothetical protein